MNQKPYKRSLASVGLLLLTLPHVAAAAISNIDDPAGRVKQFQFHDGDPTNIQSVATSLWSHTVDSILLPLFGGLAILFLIVAGIQYISAAGNAERLKKARQNIINILLGIILLVATYTLINLITGLARYLAGRV